MYRINLDINNNGIIDTVEVDDNPWGYNYYFLHGIPSEENIGIDEQKQITGLF